MPPTFYSFLHVSSVLLLAGTTFYAVAAPQASKKRVMIASGILSLLALVGGFGLLSKVYSNQFYLWVIVKLVAWLALSGLAGLAFRKRDKAGLWLLLASALLVLAVAMVYFKPGM